MPRTPIPDQADFTRVVNGPLATLTGPPRVLRLEKANTGMGHSGRRGEHGDT
jgi:hypothetical protein